MLGMLGGEDGDFALELRLLRRPARQHSVQGRPYPRPRVPGSYGWYSGDGSRVELVEETVYPGLWQRSVKFILLGCGQEQGKRFAVDGTQGWVG